MVVIFCRETSVPLPAHQIPSDFRNCVMIGPNLEHRLKTRTENATGIMQEEEREKKTRERRVKFIFQL